MSRAYQRKAYKLWPNAIWIEGNDRFALVASCNGEPTVTLWKTHEEANRQKAWIDDTGCGGNCQRWHLIHDIREMPSGCLEGQVLEGNEEAL